MPHRIVSPQTLAKIHQLLTQMRHAIASESEVWLISQAVLAAASTDVHQFPAQFAVLVSPAFSVLMRAQTVAPAAIQPSGDLVNLGTTEHESVYQLDLSFAPADIQAFLDQLSQHLHAIPGTLASLHHMQQAVQPNQTQWQNRFTLQLIETLSSPASPADPTPAAPPYPSVLVWQPVQDALDSSLEQALIISQVANQIRQSLDLPLILQTAVDQVRQFLDSDRLVVYRMATATDLELTDTFDEPPTALDQPTATEVEVKPHLDHGYVAYEARGSDDVASVLPFVERQCFTEQAHCYHKYLTGKIVVVNDTEATYALIPCLLDFLREGQIRAKLIAPIIVHNQLWGLLIAHQCQPRQWKVAEQKFMEHMANHLAIAIGQAQLYAQLQAQTQTLEQRVLERTQSLHDALRAAQLADQAKSEFLATMSHEFRTPLTCVIGMSATLLRWSIGELNDRQRSYLQTIHDSGAKLLELINNILDMSQIEAGRTLLDIQPFSVAGLVSQVMKSLKATAQARDVSLELDLKAGTEPDRIVADPRRVRQILQNLLSNAIKFTPAQGTVTLRVRPESQAVLFRVEDTGIGIAEEQRPLLFQKFQQLDPTRQRSYEGVGLGLALTKQLVDLHGGTLEVSSQIGVGSIFTVRIPDQRPRQAAKSLQAPDILTEGQRVLLFEPDEYTANVICDMLTAAGMQVVWMVDGSALVEQIELIQPDLLLIDVELPGLNPVEVTRSRQRLWNHNPANLVLVTPRADHPLIAACFDDEVATVVTKPIQPQQLMQTINALLYPNVSVERP